MKLLTILTIILFSASCKKDPAGTPTPVDNPKTQAVLISPDTSLLLKNTSIQLTYTFNPPDTLQTRLLWSSSNENIATVDGYGKVTAVGEGLVTITATSERDAKVRGSAVVNALREYDVYYGGDGFFYGHGKYIALPGGHYGVFGVNAITISGDEVYVAGYTSTPNFWQVPTYWKNEQVVQLTPEVENEQNIAKSITIKDSIVYVAGRKFFDPGCPNNCGNYQNRGYYWRSAPSGITEIPLFDNQTTHSDANSITTNLNGDVLIAGINTYPGSYGIASVWKNQFSEAIGLSGSTAFGGATAIGTIGNDIYVAGVEGCAFTNCTNPAKLWKNNSSNAITLSRPGAGASPTAMFIQGQDIYISGYETNYSGTRVAKFWKVSGNSVTSFDITNGQTDAVAFSLYLIDDNIFLAGFEDDPQQHRIPKYWRVVGTRSVEIVPYLPVVNGISIDAIAVKRL